MIKITAKGPLASTAGGRLRDSAPSKAPANERCLLEPWVSWPRCGTLIGISANACRANYSQRGPATSQRSVYRLESRPQGGVAV